METKETGLTILESNKPTLTQLVLVNMPHGTTTEEAQRMALKEISNFQMLAQLKPDLMACTPTSVLLAVKQCICDNLTLAPSSGLVYLVPSRVKVGQNGTQDVYDWILTYDPTANGRLSIARQSGRILDNKRPAVTYDGEGKVDTVTVEFLVPSFPQPRWEVITFTKTHFQKWMQASARKNKGNPNPNYLSWNGSIDPEFAGTKAIRHGLGKLGTNMNESNRTMPGAPLKYEPVSNVMQEAQEENADEGKGYVNFEELPQTEPNTNQSNNTDAIPDLV